MVLNILDGTMFKKDTSFLAHIKLKTIGLVFTAACAVSGLALITNSLVTRLATLF